MKKLIYLFFAISLFHHFAFSQWVQQTSGVSTGLVEVRFIDENTGWVCGTGGTILKTTNGGTNWTIQNSGTPTKPMGDIFPVDANIIYCVGWFETILKSTNGGTNWSAIRNGPDNTGKNYLGVHFINNNTGWITGQGSYVLRTTNGCLSFDSSFVPAIFYDIYFKDSINGLISGQNETLFKSSNGGINWFQINVLGEAAEFFELTFIGDTGWIAGWQNRKVYKTTNFGTTWDSLSRVTPEPDIWSATSIFFSSLNTGWVCGGAGNIWRTSNGGFNWFKQVTPSNLGYGGIYFVTDSIGWSLGNSGLIVHTTTSGQIVGLTSENNSVPEVFRLFQNYPNPFNPKTIIKYEVGEKSYIKINLYNIQGRLLKTIVSMEHNANSYEMPFDAGNFSSGIYFYSLIANGSIVAIKKMILVK